MLQGPTAATRTGDSLERALLRAAGAVVATLVAVCGVVIMARRLGGSFGPVGGAGTLVIAALGGLLVLAVDAVARLAWLSAPWRAAARAGYLLAWAAVGLPPAAGSPTDAVLFVVAAGVAGTLVVEPFIRGGIGPWIAGIRRRTPRLSAVINRPPRGPTEGADPAPCPGHLLQRFERYELDGVDCLRGTIALTVPQGFRSAHGHVGFCPSFRHLPQVEATTQYDGVEAVVTAAEVVPWGARIECRLDEPAEEPVEIPVDVVARASA